MTKYIAFLIPLISSCCGIHTEVNYIYKEIRVTRIDECGITTFYYQRGQIMSSGKIWAKYSGINDGFSGYLKFNETGKVFLLSGDGYFQSEDIDSTKFEYKRIGALERPEIGKNVCMIKLSTRYEKEVNDKEETGIRIIYSTDNK